MAGVDEALGLIPRAYQEEIFEQARRANVIATLDTGSGKTFIAALLIKWAMAQMSAAGKKAIFLVPKVPLVDQQRDFLVAQTPLTVRGYKGAMGVDAWDKSRWQTEFSQTDCLVMTAQIFKDVLTHGYWTMDQVSLLVFDECHHTQSNHPYNMIMVDHYAICKNKPRIFGMTASPVWNPKHPMLSIQTLQYNLFSKIMAVREHAEQLDQHSNKPIEVILKYPSSSLCYPTYHSPSLWEYLQAEELLNIPGLSIRALQVRYDATFRAIGPVGADYFLVYNLTDLTKEYSRLAYEQSLKAPSVVSNLSESKVSSRELDQQGKDQRIADGVEKLRSVLSAFDVRLSSEIDTLPSEWLSPKLHAAINVLVEHRSDAFQGIIFVEQRQVASTMSWILRRVAETKDWIRCGELTGHGEATNGKNSKGMSINAQKEVVHSFKARNLNLLIATSVAEEGLDFPACELVIRYDTIHHMVGYLQSRGRAREQRSTYVVMVEENDTEKLERYKGFRDVEPTLKKVYQSLNVPSAATSSENELESESKDEQVDPRDLTARDSYIIPSTGAILTYSSAIDLLSHLCSLIPRDSYTPPLQPKYSGDHKATVRLPQALPLASNQLIYEGPLKRSKKEAKRAVAFIAVRALHLLGVFDDHLSPIKSRKGEAIEDADGRPIAKVSAVNKMMDVHVASPWKAGPPWYMYVVSLEGRACAGLITGNILPEVDLGIRGTRVHLRRCASQQLVKLTSSHLDLLEEFTRMGLWWCVTASPITSSLACFLTPLDGSGAIDWAVMERAVVDTRGSYDWSSVTERDEGRMMLVNTKKWGRPLLLKKFRSDLSLDAKPCFEDVQEKDYATYAEYFERTYPRYYSKNTHVNLVPKAPEGPILEVTAMPRYPSTSYDRESSDMQADAETASQLASSFLLPQSYCRYVVLSMDAIKSFQVFSPLCQRICDVFRARIALRLLKFPPIPDELMIEALTLPCANAGFNNQRLETMGDSVLKLSVVTYLYNRFPCKHEGQLSALKSNSVSNRLLLARAREVQLERFLSSEKRGIRTWRFVLPCAADAGMCKAEGEEVPLVRMTFPRRSLQDCMEASLGASYVSGGIDAALRTGTALGLCFGGASPWIERYPVPEGAPSAALFNKLQEDLQYKFRNGNLLLEAVKHASFDSQEGSCYQRLEFVGDAVIELIVTTYLYNKFPEANSGQLTWTRSRAVCNTTLAALAVKRLSLHKYLLANNVALSKDIAKEVETLSAAPYEDLAINDWKYDPPKVLGDLFESVLGAMFVDSGFNYPLVVPIVERVMDDVLKILKPDVLRNPVVRLLEWVAKAGCVKAKFKKVESSPLVNRKDSVVVVVHGRVVAGPIPAANRPLAKGLASAEAMAVLSDATSELALHRICDCMKAVEDENMPLRDVREKDLNLETEADFALAGRLRLEEVAQDEQVEIEKVYDEELDDSELECQEVELLLHTPSLSASGLCSPGSS